MKEIGSEFWKSKKEHIRKDETVYLSGRTALDVIIKDAIKSYHITSALLPSYCCHTMIEPFMINGINVRFYDVYIEDNILMADIPLPEKREMLYIMKYFGDTDLHYEGEGRNLSGWATTVEDLTHSCFAEGYSTHADYWFTSDRKWFGVAGIAVAGKRNGKLSEPTRGQNRVYCELRNQAFLLKQQFMTGKLLEKQEYLDMFGKAEQLLGKDYRDFGAGYEDVYDLFYFLEGADALRRKRRDNAKILTEKLTGLDFIHVFVDFEDDEKCPLFVPIVVDHGMRDSLRKYLISKDIYCPVHWPLSEQHKGITKRAAKIYEKELSLVCDQRYDTDDMERILYEIREFLMIK